MKTLEELHAAKLAGQKRWREANRAHRTAEHRRWRASNPERARELSREAFSRYAGSADDLARRTRANNSRRARLAGSNPDLTAVEWEEILEEFDHRCAYCQARGVPLEQEHMTPISRGGRHTKTNVVPACRSCNARKGARNLFEFASTA